MRRALLSLVLATLLISLLPGQGESATAKPPLHARHWLAITGKPLGATAGAKIFERGGNAVDAACAMLAATCTMWDTLGWGGETQALIWHPGLKKVIAVNALGTAPTGATPEFFHQRGMQYPPEYGPLAAVVPGTPGGLMTMLAEYGTMSLAEVLQPAMEMAEGYAIEAQLANTIERYKKDISGWKMSPSVFLPHRGQPRESPVAGEVFRQPDLRSTLGKLIEAEAQAKAAGKDRKQAIYAAYERFYRGDIAREIARGTQAEGGLITEQDLAGWKVQIEEPVSTTYRGIEVYKLDTWTQGPAMLQALNILETMDLKSMGYDSARYIHAVYQAMNLAFADRDFYYGDPAFPPAEPLRGLLSKEYAKRRAASIDWKRNDPAVKPGDPYPFQSESNPYSMILGQWPPARPEKQASVDFDDAFRAGTTSIEAADAQGWVVSVTPSGGWVPAFIPGSSGIGLSQRMQSFVLDERESPFNVLAPGKRPRVTLTPTMALKDGAPYLAFAVQGGDTQDQNLLQFFLNVVEFGMTVQEATEAANITSYQMHSSFGDHESEPGRLTLAESVSPWVRDELKKMGYKIDTERLTSGPINALMVDREHGTFWGGSSQHGEDYGIAW